MARPSPIGHRPARSPRHAPDVAAGPQPRDASPPSCWSSRRSAWRGRRWTLPGWSASTRRGWYRRSSHCSRRCPASRPSRCSMCGSCWRCWRRSGLAWRVVARPSGARLRAAARACCARRGRHRAGLRRLSRLLGTQLSSATDHPAAWTSIGRASRPPKSTAASRRAVAELNAPPPGRARRTAGDADAGGHAGAAGAGLCGGAAGAGRASGWRRRGGRRSRCCRRFSAGRRWTAW